MGIVNMVRLLKLLFFIYLVPPVLVGLNIRLVLHVILWFLEKQKFGVIFHFSGIFQLSPLVACWGDIEASEQI